MSAGMIGATWSVDVAARRSKLRGLPLTDVRHLHSPEKAPFVIIKTSIKRHSFWTQLFGSVTRRMIIVLRNGD
jgi:IS4 transposase